MKLLTLAHGLTTVANMQTESGPRSKPTSYLRRPEGRVAYDVDGDGPLVVLVPGMGDLRATYRFIAPVLREAGYRVALMDLRGHGDSDATFATYGDVETASDIIALIEELGGPASIVGNSMGAAAAVIVAAQRPDLVDGLVLVGPFVRSALTWKSYLPKLYAGRRPADFEAYRKQVVASLHRPGHAKAFSRTTHISHDPAEARLHDVRAATLVVMGEKDPDFPDPKAEAAWIAEVLHGEVVMVPEAGHYAQSQQPDTTANAVLGFLKGLKDRA